MSASYRHRGAEILALMEEMHAMSERSAIDALHSFRVSMYIYARNHQEVAKFVNFIRTDPSNQDIAAQNTQRKRDALHYEIARQFQNYVASVDALVEHAETLYERLYKGGNRFPDYPTKRTALHDDPVVHFTTRLRNVLLHGETAKTMFHFRLGDEWSTITLGLPVEFLNRHKTWFKKPAAKAYLRGVKDFVDIAELLEQCNQKVEAFASWFAQRQQEIHAEELHRFAEKERELFTLQIEDALDGWLAHPDPVNYMAPGDEGVFHGMFDTSEFNELKRLPEGSLARAELAVRMLEQRFDVSDELKNKVLRCYTDPNFFRHDLLQPKTMDEWLAENEGESQSDS